MSASPAVTDAVEAVCSFCGHPDRYDVERGRFDLSEVGRLQATFPPVVSLTLTCRGCGRDFFHAVRGPRRLVGYHGCTLEFARKITTPGVDIEEWNYSDRAWDWLGDGIYFWEEAPLRAWEWAVEVCGRKGGTPAVVGALIAPRTLIDLGDTEFADRLRAAYNAVGSRFERVGKALPANRPFAANPADPDRKFRELDRLVVEELAGGLSRERVVVEAVRAPFEEGDPVYPGAAIYLRSHVQIAVRDPTRIRYKWLERWE